MQILRYFVLNIEFYIVLTHSIKRFTDYTIVILNTILYNLRSGLLQ